MKVVRTLQKYKCDFCNYRSIKHVVATHEKRCFRNPDRYCDYCENKGYIMEHYEEHGSQKLDCPYCASFNKDKLKAIEEYEKALDNSGGGGGSGRVYKVGNQIMSEQEHENWKRLNENR